MKSRYVEVCAGAGGMGLGLHMAGWTGTGMEIDADAVATHLANVGPCLLADIITAHSPHGADLVAGGVPCQSFSIAGKGEGLGDPRGQLFASLLRIGVESGARCILLENVRGLVSCGALPVILAAFRAAGYEPVHALLCAADYGVPQNRVRLFIAGFRCADDLARFHWPAPSHGAPGNLYGLPRWRTVRDALDLPAGDYAHGPLPHARKSRSQGMMIVDVDAPARTVAGRNNADWLDRPAMATALDRPSPTVTGQVQDLSFDGANSRDPLRAALAAAGLNDRPATTVDSLGALSKAGHHESNKTGAIRLTVAQLAALQSFPAGFAFAGNLSAQHRQCGNAVPPLLARALGVAIHRALYGVVAIAGVA